MARQHNSKEAYEDIILPQNFGIYHLSVCVHYLLVYVTPLVCLLSPGKVEVHQGPKLRLIYSSQVC